MKKLTLSAEECKKVSIRNTPQSHKYKRMIVGFSSYLVNYVDGIIYLEISNNQTQIFSTYKTAVYFAQKYRDFNPELKDAVGFVVIFYDRDNILGFVVTKDTRSEALQELVDELRKPENPRIKTVYAGMFNDETEKIELYLARKN